VWPVAILSDSREAEAKAPDGGRPCSILLAHLGWAAPDGRAADAPLDWRILRRDVEMGRALVIYFEDPTRGGMVDEAALVVRAELCPVRTTTRWRFYQRCETG
jgi:hypothetical protein